MSGHRIIQTCLLASLAVIGCRSSELNVVRQKRVSAQSIIDERIANAPEERMPKILPETHYAAARLLEEQGQFGKAMIQYRKAIAVNHKYVAAYHRLGMLLSKVGRHELAVEMLRQAVALKPDEAILRNNIGFEMMFLEQWTLAKEHFIKAIELNPRLARAHVNLGLVLSKLGEFDQALESFQAVLPEADAYYNLGLIYRGQKRYEDAVRAFEHVLKCNPKFTAAQMQLAELTGYIESPQERIANRSTQADSVRAPELPLTIDRIDPVAEQVINNHKRSPAQDLAVYGVTAKAVAPAEQDKMTQKQDREEGAKSNQDKEKWESVFDELADLYSNHQPVPGKKDRNAVRETQSAGVIDPEDVADANDDDPTGNREKMSIPISSPRVSVVIPRALGSERLMRETEEFFLTNHPIHDVDAPDAIIAMKGLSLDEPIEEPSAAANRPAVIPHTLDWFRDQLSIVRNEIACLEMKREETSMPVFMEWDIQEHNPPAPPMTTNRSILVNDQEPQSRPRTKRSKPITDAGTLSTDQLLAIINGKQHQHSPFGAFIEMFNLLFAQSKQTGDLKDLTAIVMNELDCREDVEDDQHVAYTPVDQTKKWLLREFGDAARWLLQVEPEQSVDKPARDDERDDESVSTIEEIIRSARALVLGSTTQ